MGVLLKAQNYDYSQQQISNLASTLTAGSVAMVVLNTEGITAGDYILIHPKNEIAEIVQVQNIDSNTSITLNTPCKFEHPTGIAIYRLTYNQIKLYESTTFDGTYTEITGSPIEMEYSTTHTNFYYISGSSSSFYKRTFYNPLNGQESDIALSQYWQNNDEELYVTPEELRVWLQFNENDYPSNDDMAMLIKIAQDKMSFDITSSDNRFLRIATLLLSKSFVMRGLATRAIRKGYVTVNAEGRNITKAYQELVLEAENVYEEYMTFIKAVNRSEVTSTQFMNDTTVISGVTRQKIIDIMDGTQNAMDYDSQSRRPYGRTLRA